MKPQFIAIVGGSGSGKSWLANRLANQLGRRVARLSQDDFYADRSRLTIAQRKLVNLALQQNLWVIWSGIGCKSMTFWDWILVGGVSGELEVLGVQAPDGASFGSEPAAGLV